MLQKMGHYISEREQWNIFRFRWRCPQYAEVRYYLASKERSKANKNIPNRGANDFDLEIVIQEEREIPPLMSRNYMNPNTVKKKEYLLLHAFD